MSGARRSARLNDLEAKKLEGVLARQGLRPTADAIGVTVTALEQVRHSGAATPVTVARVRGFLVPSLLEASQAETLPAPPEAP